MENSPELDGKYLGTITHDFIKVCDTLKEAAYQTKMRKISSYPFFIFSKEPIKSGLALFLRRDHPHLLWDIYASIAEVIHNEGGMTDEGWEAFKETYRDSEEYACLMILDENFNKFVYLPYPDENSGEHPELE